MYYADMLYSTHTDRAALSVCSWLYKYSLKLIVTTCIRFVTICDLNTLSPTDFEVLRLIRFEVTTFTWSRSRDVMGHVAIRPVLS